MQKTENMQKNTKWQKITRLFGGGLKHGQEAIPLFCPKKGIFKILKNPYL